MSTSDTDVPVVSTAPNEPPVDPIPAATQRHPAHLCVPSGEGYGAAGAASAVLTFEARGGRVAKYAIFFTLKPETVSGMMQKPSDRAAVVSKLLESVGGTLEAYYWMLGQWDGFVVGNAPDGASAAAVSLAVSSTGAFGHLETHEVFDANQINDLLERAKSSVGQYTPPGA
jgi:uncharacterized protein with GYD domain